MVRLFREELSRLFANAMSVIITIGLVVIPSLFTWYNVLACWDVFENTGDLKVAVANVDEGYKSDLIPIRVNVGEQVISALRANDQIDWVFTSEDDAVDGAKSGRYYAAVVIPEEFSRDMLTFYSDDVEHAQIIYYANEKKNAIAPKITDKGADSVSYQVNQVFAQTLSEVALGIAESLSQYAENADVDGTIGTLIGHVNAMADQIDRTASVLDLYASLARSSQSLAADSAALITSARQGVSEVAGAAGEGSSSVESLVGALGDSAQSLSDALAQSEQSLQAIADNVNAVFDAASAGALECAAQLRAQGDATGSQIQQYRDVVADLEQLRDSVPEEYRQAIDGTIAMMNASIELLENVQKGLYGAADDIEAGNAGAQAQRDEIKAQAQAAKDSIAALRENYDANVKPGLEKLAVDAQALVQSVRAGLEKLDAASVDLTGSVVSVGGVLGQAADKITAASSDLRATAQEMRDLSARVSEALAAGDTEQVRAILGTDVQALAKAIAAPVGVDRIAVYPVENFGSAMAPLYTTLALFIGSLLILVAMKPKATPAACRNLVNPKPYQLFLGHFGIIALMSLLQTTVMGLGNMLFLQVQVVHPLLFMICFWLSGLVFVFLIYALVAAFANLGKAIAVLLLIVQVTGCGGSYPLQLLPDFVQGLSPYLPATHVVNAMRAAMMGTYGNDFWMAIGALLVFLVPAAVIGLVLRKPFSRFMEWYVERVESSKLIA